MTWFSLRVEPGSHRDEAIAALFDSGAQGVQEDGNALVTSFPDEGTARAAADAAVAADPGARCDIHRAPAVDWSIAWRAHARVVSSGRFAIAPPWLAEGLDPARTIVIDPGMAFGTGEHGSTRGAARLLESAVREGDVVADLGSGSAVLSILAARLGAARVWAIELDPDAQGNATENVARNHVDDRVQLLTGDAALLLPVVAPVDGLSANILSSVIVELLPAMAQALRPGGWAVLAGIMVSEQDQVRDALRDGEWEVEDTVTEEEWWSALVRR